MYFRCKIKIISHESYVKVSVSILLSSSPYSQYASDDLQYFCKNGLIQAEICCLVSSGAPYCIDFEFDAWLTKE